MENLIVSDLEIRKSCDPKYIMIYFDYYFSFINF